MGSRGGGSQTTTQTMPAFQQRFLQNTLLPFAKDISEQDFTPYNEALTATVPTASSGALGVFEAIGQPSAARTQATDIYGNLMQPTEFGQRAASLYGGSIDPTTGETMAMDLYGQLSQPTALGQQAASLYGDVTQRTAGEQAAAGLYGDIAGFANLTPADYAAMTEANLSPYTSNVIDAALARSARERDIARTGEMADITRAGAFGNERRGVYEAEREAAYEIGRDQMIADLLAQGYSQAQAATMAQLEARRAAAATGASGLANLGAAERAALATGAAGMAGLSDAERAAISQSAAGVAGLGAAERAALQAGAAGFAGLSQAERAAAEAAASGLSQAERDRIGALGQSAEGMLRVGGLEQATEQARLDALYQEFLREQNLPYQQLGALSSAAGGIPTMTSTTTQNRPGIFDYLTAGATAYGAYQGSDRRLKRNIQHIDTVSGVKFYTWEWNEIADQIGVSGDRTVGVIAQELEAIYPELVIEGSDGYLRVNYGGLAAKLQEAA